MKGKERELQEFIEVELCTRAQIFRYFSESEKIPWCMVSRSNVLTYDGAIEIRRTLKSCKEDRSKVSRGRRKRKESKL